MSDRDPTDGTPECLEKGGDAPSDANQVTSKATRERTLSAPKGESDSAHADFATIQETLESLKSALTTLQPCIACKNGVTQHTSCRLALKAVGALEALARLHGTMAQRRQCSFKQSAGEWKGGAPVMYCCLRDEGHSGVHTFAWPTEMDAKAAAWDALYGYVGNHDRLWNPKQHMRVLLAKENGRIANG